MWASFTYIPTACKTITRNYDKIIITTVGRVTSSHVCLRVQINLPCEDLFSVIRPISFSLLELQALCLSSLNQTRGDQLLCVGWTGQGCTWRCSRVGSKILLFAVNWTHVYNPFSSSVEPIHLVSADENMGTSITFYVTERQPHCLSVRRKHIKSVAHHTCQIRQMGFAPCVHT